MGRIVSLSEVMSYGKLTERRVDGPVLDALILASESFIERYARRLFAPQPALDPDGGDTLPPVTKSFSVSAGRKVLRIRDLREIVSVALDGAAMVRDSGYQIDNYQEPATSVVLTVPYGYAGGGGSGYPAGFIYTGGRPYGFGQMTITGRWGWNPVPDDIRHAVMALTMRLYRERDASWGDTVTFADGTVTSYFRSLPASIQAVVLGYQPPNIALV